MRAVDDCNIVKMTITVNTKINHYDYFCLWNWFDM
nr:MAG TPA: hypothetical protein [Caudoviricetes sp.]